MENNQNLNNNTETEVVENTTVENTTETTTENNNTTDEELFAKLDAILEKRSQGIAKSVLKDNGAEDAEIGEILGRYKASKQTAKNKAAEELTALQTKNAELTKKLFDIDLNKAATKAAAEIDMNSEKLPYAMKLADTTKAIKDGKIDEAELKSALEDVLKSIPEFKNKQKEEEKPVVRKIGVEDKEPDKKNSTYAAMAKAFGLPEEE